MNTSGRYEMTDETPTPFDPNVVSYLIEVLVDRVVALEDRVHELEQRREDHA